MEHTLYVTDLDGTLLNASAQVSERSASIISALSRRGVLITVATARTPATVVPLLRHTFTRPGAIVMTGAAVWDRKEARMTHMRLIPSEEVMPAAEILAGHGLTPFIYTVTHEGRTSEPPLRVYHAAGELTRQERSFVDARLELPLKRFYLHTPMPPELSSDVILMFATGALASIEAAAARLSLATSCAVSAYPDTYSPQFGLIEVFGPDVSKASAIKALAKRLDARRIVAFGDNLNDLPMLEEADVAVAVDNALPPVKAAADVVIGPNTADSVARFIARHSGHPDLAFES